MNKLATLMACALLVCGGVQADPVRQEQVDLVQGAPLKKLGGKIKGEETAEYRIAVQAGGTLSLKLKSANRSSNFNVSVDGTDEALFVGSRDGTHFETTATAKTVYKVGIYLMRNAARRNEQASYVLEVAVSAPATAR